MSSKRKMHARKKATENRTRRGGDNPSGKSRYALKLVQQNRGRFSPRSPFRAGPVEDTTP